MRREKGLQGIQSQAAFLFVRTVTLVAVVDQDWPRAFLKELNFFSVQLDVVFGGRFRGTGATRHRNSSQGQNQSVFQNHVAGVAILRVVPFFRICRE